MTEPPRETANLSVENELDRLLGEIARLRDSHVLAFNGKPPTNPVLSALLPVR